MADAGFAAPLYHAPGRITFVGRPRPLLTIGTSLSVMERCGISGCDRVASLAADAVLDEERQGEVHLCTLHAGPLLEA